MRENRGITLIALIIMIIVLLILAGVTITTLTGDNGLFGKTTESRFKSEIKQYEEELKLSIHEDEIEKLGNRTEKFNVRRKQYDETNDGIKNFTNEMKNKIPSFSMKYANKLEIKNDKLIYMGLDNDERRWLSEVQIKLAKILKINYNDIYGNKMAEPYIATISDDEYLVKSPVINGYKPFYDEVEGEITEDEEINVIYYKESEGLLYKGIDEKGNTTDDESKIVSYMIGDGSSVRGNGKGDFSGEYLIIPDMYNGKKVTKINKYSFNGNSEIRVIILPKDIEETGDNSFQSCSNLEKLRIPRGNIKNLSFYGCNKLEEVIIGRDQVTLQASVFNGCKNLSRFLIRSEDFALCNYAPFSGCENLKEIKITKDNNAYESVNGIIYTVDMKKLIMYPVAKDNEEFIIPDSVEEVGFAAISNNRKLKKIIIPQTVKIIKERGIEGSINLEEAYISAGQLSTQTFYSCQKLKKVEINSENINLGVACFSQNKELSDLTFNCEKIRIGEYSCFAGCEKLKEIKTSNNGGYTTQNGVLFTNDMKELILYPVGKETEEYFIPDTVKIIRNSAFHDSINLKNVRGSSTMEEVETRVFESCPKLEEVEIDVKRIGLQAFYNSTNINKLKLGKNLNYIGWHCFGNDTKLTEIIYNSTMSDWNSVEKSNAWKDNSNITKIKCTDGEVDI